MHHRGRTLVSVFVLPLFLLSTAKAVTPAWGELAERDRFVAERFGALVDAKRQIPPPVTVLANHDSVQQNGRLSRLLNLAGKPFERGLFCHAPSKLHVKLHQKARRFNAIIGVDRNEQTRGGRGSVVFVVATKEKELFRSETLREGMPGVPIEVDLDGADEFTLEVHDAGDGISCDQADWAEAVVTTTGGRSIYLGDLPIEQPNRTRYAPGLPFSFTYAGRPSAEFLKTWKTSREPGSKPGEAVLVYTDPATGLELRVDVVQYASFPTIEWTLHFRNTGTKDTPILADIQPLDLVLERYRWNEAELAEYVLHHHTGSPYSPTDYQPHETKLRPKTSVRFAPPGGRPSDSILPYFAVEWPSEGLLMAIGWPGQWAASFTRDNGVGLAIRAGQERTAFVLKPGESVRTPLVVLQFFKGDRARAQNVWRKWMLEHNVPRRGRQLPGAQLAACSSHQFAEMIHANEENQKLFVDRYLQHGIKLDYWWMDAGWYVNKTGWPNTGTWEIDGKRFPRGLRAITDHAHEKQVESIVWFEPERVTPGTWLYERKEWLLGRDGETKLLDLGNGAARQWLLEHVDRLIVGQGIDLYRQDFNIDPLSFWRGGDPADRQGIAEIRYVTGLLSYWDELRRRHPGMLIDTCASGGRRNDLETLRRAVPLLRSDYILEPVSQQNHTYGIASWIPFYGTGVNAFDAYTFRSQMCPHSTACYDMRNGNQDFPAVKRLVEQWRALGPFYFGDFYPLTPYNPRADAWMGWQFHRDDQGSGFVQVFRRHESIYEAARLRLRGLAVNGRYTVVNLDAATSSVEYTGAALMQSGLPVTIADQPGAIILRYERKFR